MIATLLLLLPTFPPPMPALAQDPPREEEPAEIPPDQAVKMLKDAFADKNPEAALQALETCGRIADKSVVKQLTLGFKERDPRVRLATLQALRFNDDPSALGALLKQARSKKLLDDKEFAAQYYLALGQKGDPKAIKVLVDGLAVDNGGNPITRARLMALGHIRDRRSVEELMDFWVKGKARRGHPYARELSLALGVLTGEDRRSRDQWIDWWNDNRKSFKVAPEEYELPRQYQRQWQQLWASPEEKEAARKKEKERRRERDGDGDPDAG